MILEFYIIYWNFCKWITNVAGDERKSTNVERDEHDERRWWWRRRGRGRREKGQGPGGGEALVNSVWACSQIHITPRFHIHRGCNAIYESWLSTAAAEARKQISREDARFYSNRITQCDLKSYQLRQWSTEVNQIEGKRKFVKVPSLRTL